MNEELPENKDLTPRIGYKTIIYSKDDSGKYGRIPRPGFEPEEIALQQVWDDLHEHLSQTRKRVSDGELSVLAYYIEKHQFTVGRLASLTGFPKRRIRKHLSPKAYDALDRNTLETYAKVFRVSVGDLSGKVMI